MAMKTDTMLMLGGLGLLGFGLFYMMNKQSAGLPSGDDIENRINQAADAYARAAGVTNEAQMDEIRTMIADQAPGMSDPAPAVQRQAEQSLTADLVSTGLPMLPDLIKTIGGLFKPTV